MSSETRRFFRECEQRGWTVMQHDSKRFKLTHPNASRPIFANSDVDSSPSYKENVIHQLQRALRDGDSELDDARGKVANAQKAIRALREENETLKAKHIEEVTQLRTWLDQAKSQAVQNTEAFELIGTTRKERDDALFRVLELEDELKGSRQALADAHATIVRLTISGVSAPPVQAAPQPSEPPPPRRPIAVPGSSGGRWLWTNARIELFQRIGRCAMPIEEIHAQLAALPGEVGTVTATGQRLVKLRHEWREKGIPYDSLRGGGFTPLPSYATVPAPVEPIPEPTPEPTPEPEPELPAVAIPDPVEAEWDDGRAGRWDWTPERMAAIARHTARRPRIHTLGLLADLEALPGAVGTRKAAVVRADLVRRGVLQVAAELAAAPPPAAKPPVVKAVPEGKWDWTEERLVILAEHHGSISHLLAKLKASPGSVGTRKGAVGKLDRLRAERRIGAASAPPGDTKNPWEWTEERRALLQQLIERSGLRSKAMQERVAALPGRVGSIAAFYKMVQHTRDRVTG
jgi:hypothetical protein